MWDASTGDEIHTLQGHTDVVYRISFSPDGTRIASASSDDTIKLWDASTGEELRTFKGHTDFVYSVRFSPDGTRIASGSWDDKIKLWDATTGEELRTLTGHTSGVLSVSFNPDGTRIASASWDKTIKLWDATTGEELRTLTGHTSPVESVSFSPEGTSLYSQSFSENLVWNPSTGQIVPGAKWKSQDISNRHERWLAVPSDGSILVVDTEFRNTPREKAYRRFKSKPKPRWHREQMRVARTANDAFAVTFHAGWLLTLDTSSREAYEVLHQAHRELPKAVANLLPPVISRSLALPKPQVPTLSIREAQFINGRIRRIVVFSPSRLSNYDVAQMEAVIRDVPHGLHFSTLGVTRYRTGNYEAAIEASLKSVELTPKEIEIPGPLPIDYAILAMSHLQLDRKEEAEKYREQLTEAMKAPFFKDVNECLKFVREVDTLFASQSTSGSDAKPEP